MKKKILFILSGLITMISSCQQGEVGEVQEDKSTVQFIVSAESSMQSRSSVTDLKRFVIEVYESASPSGEPVTHIEQSNGTFNLLLKDDVKYTFLFWADYGTPNSNSGEYDVTDLKAVKISNQPTNPAWSKKVSFTKGEESMSDYNVVLSHSVAQINFIQCENFTKENNTLKVIFPKTFSLNVADKSTTEITNSGLSQPTTYTFTTTTKEQKNRILGTSYIIANSLNKSDDAKTVLDLSTELNDGETTLSINSVPFACNYKTNITGAYSNLYINTTNITCDFDWNTTGYAAPDPGSGSGSAEPEVSLPRIGDYYYSDNTFWDEYDNSKTCLGVVFYIDPTDNTKGKIVSIASTNTSWSSQSVSNEIENTEDGEINCAKLESLVDINYYQAFLFCKNLGSGWYLPAVNELSTLFHESDALMQLWIIGDGEIIETGSYWSSNENDKDFAYAYDADFNVSNRIEKSIFCKVRAVRKFDL